jgi:2,3-bisphosphoglycerate-independent phosphoglycerate mutase
LEAIDQHIVGPLAEWIEETADSRILVSPDHPTPLRTRTHSHGAVPLAMAGHGVSADGQQAYHERAAAASGLVFDAGWHVMEFFLGRGGNS